MGRFKRWRPGSYVLVFRPVPDPDHSSIDAPFDWGRPEHNSADLAMRIDANLIAGWSGPHRTSRASGLVTLHYHPLRRVARTNSDRSRPNRSGASNCTAWPTPPYTRSFAPGTVATVWVAALTRTIRSASPCMTSVGTRMPVSTSSLSSTRSNIAARTAGDTIIAVP